MRLRKTEEEKKANDKTHKEKIKAKNHAYYEAHQDEIKNQKKARRKANKEEINARERANHKANKEEINAKRRANYEAHKEENKAKRQTNTNKEKIKARNKAYREANREKLNANKRAKRQTQKEERNVNGKAHDETKKQAKRKERDTGQIVESRPKKRQRKSLVDDSSVIQDLSHQNPVMTQSTPEVTTQPADILPSEENMPMLFDSVEEYLEYNGNLDQKQNSPDDSYQNPLTARHLFFGDKIQKIALGAQELGRAKMPSEEEREENFLNSIFNFQW